MDKRYQVFVSSTYEDLREERQKVIQALLEFDCIPAGMEFFPAADETQWELIKRVIEDCDYYVVIVGGRYGSVSPKGISYTQQEYEYAVEVGKPVCAFLHADPGKIPANKTELNEESRKKLDEFRLLCEKKMCKYWETADQLGGLVIGSLNQLKKTRPAVGWTRADQIADEATAQMILRLKNRVEELEMELKLSQTEPPKGTEDLAQGEDEFILHYEFVKGLFGDKNGYSFGSIVLTWNKIVSLLGPLMLNEAPEYDLNRELASYVFSCQRHKLQLKNNGLDEPRLVLNSDDTKVIIIQLRSLGLIRQSIKQRSLKDTQTYWTLTPYGDNVMTRLLAIRRNGKKAKRSKR
jgi:hypothetical protein